MGNYSFKDFLPLVLILLLVAFITSAHQLYYGWCFREAMRILMASFFLIFGFFKIINLHEFAKAYATYDLVTQKYFWYGYLYPFLELGLGIAYFLKLNLQLTNVLTLILMLVSAAGVLNALRKGNHIACACLGNVFKVPMTYVTLAEDLAMALMALIMLFM